MAGGSVKQNRALVEALHTLAEKAGRAGLSPDGKTAYIYQGTFEAIIDVYKAMGAQNKIEEYTNGE